MGTHQDVDITELATLGEQFPVRLMQLGFRLMQVIDEAAHDLFRYVIPPICTVPAGPFLMGSDQEQDARAKADELPQQTLLVTAFQMGTYPVTVAEYCCAVEAGVVPPLPAWNTLSHQGHPQSPDHPVVSISWFQAQTYAAWLAQVTQQPWRLPTEVEWEKAARGTDGRIYPWGNTFDGARVHDQESGAKLTTTVGIYQETGDASPYGLHDVAGNVSEWTSSRYQDYPLQPSEPVENDADASSERVFRGGNWYGHARYTHVASRFKGFPHIDILYLGVRLALSMAADTSEG